MPALFATIVAWLALPLSGATEHAIAPHVAWHARAMVLAWGILLPLGVLTARFLKILPGQGWPDRLDNPLWWNLHRGFQYLGMLLTAAGLYLVWGTAPPGEAGFGRSVHAWLGWTVAACGFLQVLGGWLRGSKGSPTEPAGDHYAMTGRRLAFERVHKALGWAAIAAGLITIAIGLWLADAPRWMPVVLIAWWTGLACAGTVLQRRGWCADTYQAIWGPSPAHPGNRIPPIGWGIRRGMEIGQRRPQARRE